jgi:hypothetical protein
MTTPPRESLLSAYVPHKSPPRPQINPVDALRCWLRNVERLADYCSTEDFSSLKELAKTAPANTLDNKEVQEVIEIVKEVAATLKFNPALSKKVSSALLKFEDRTLLA